MASTPTLGPGPALLPSSVRASPCPRRCLFRAGQGPALSPCPWEAGRRQRNWSPRPPCPLHHLGGGFWGVCGPWWGSPWADGGGCVPGSVTPVSRVTWAWMCPVSLSRVSVGPAAAWPVCPGAARSARMVDGETALTLLCPQGLAGGASSKQANDKEKRRKKKQNRKTQK